MSELGPDLTALVRTAPLAHLTTVAPDGGPQVSVIWVGLDDGDLVSAHLGHYAKIRNVERDPRVALSFLAPAEPGEFMRRYAVVYAHAEIEHGDTAWPLLNRLVKDYVGPDAEFPAPPGPGYLLRYRVDRVTGIGPWA